MIMQPVFLQLYVLVTGALVCIIEFSLIDCLVIASLVLGIKPNPFELGYEYS